MPLAPIKFFIFVLKSSEMYQKPKGKRQLEKHEKCLDQPYNQLVLIGPFLLSSIYIFPIDHYLLLSKIGLISTKIKASKWRIDSVGIEDYISSDKSVGVFWSFTILHRFCQT